MRNVILCLFLACALVLSGCATNNQSGGGGQPLLPSADKSPMPTLGAKGTGGPSSEERPINEQVQLPEKLRKGANGEPELTVYVTGKKQLEDMSLEKYLEGVLAGEMKNDWPLEALKAQAILARTFVLRFLEEKDSKYPGADVSTDIEEAQAYDASGVNDRIRDAVKQTRGVVLLADGEFPFSWFHAHSGGITAQAKEGLEYEKDEPAYIHSVKGMEGDQAPADVAKWSASFSADEVMKVAAKLGAKGGALDSIQIGQRGASGRATTIVINGNSVPAASFRIALGSTKMKSTLLDEITLSGGQVKISGRGYGHGVGMSQWGAYTLAQQGYGADQIVQYYFNKVQVDRLW